MVLWPKFDHVIHQTARFDDKNIPATWRHMKKMMKEYFYIIIKFFYGRLE